MSKPDIKYDGQHVFWFGHGNFKKKSFDATSGKKGHQTAAEQDISNVGPIPEGEYSFSIKLAGTAHVVDASRDNFELDSRQGIESLVDMKDDKGKTHNSDDWGTNRVRLNVIKIFNGDAKHRNGFYLHDSHKGFTHGCIEVDTSFFKRLRLFAEQEAKKTERGENNELARQIPVADGEHPRKDFEVVAALTSSAVPVSKPESAWDRRTQFPRQRSVPGFAD